jgi:hypothetical protein
MRLFIARHAKKMARFCTLAAGFCVYETQKRPSSLKHTNELSAVYQVQLNHASRFEKAHKSGVTFDGIFN